MTTEYPLRRSRLDSMSRFISLSSTSKSLGMINVSGGTPALTSSLCFWWCERETGVVMVSVVIDERAIRCFSIRTCKTVAVNRLDEIVRSAQVQAHGLVVHDRNHNHRDLGQFRVCLQPAEHRPAIAVGHDDVQLMYVAPDCRGRESDSLPQWTGHENGGSGTSESRGSSVSMLAKRSLPDKLRT